MNSIKCIVLLLLVSSTCMVRSARILGIFQMPARSHYFLGRAFLKGLAEKGHDVTMISPFSNEDSPKNGSYKNIVLSGMTEHMDAKRSEINMYDMSDMNPFLNIVFIASIASSVTETALSHDAVQELLRSDEKFDAVIVEQFFTEPLKALAKHFDAPLIVFSTVGSNYWINSLSGNPSPASYIPDVLLSYSSNMTFWQRFTNSLVFLANEAVHKLYLYPKYRRMIRKYISEDINLDEVIYNSSLILLNSHPSLNQPVPHVPNMIEIGGFHVEPPKQLPDDLQEFLDSAEEGVIYFSMGSNLRSADLPPEKRDVLLKVFSKLKQKVLWKWEADVLPGQPPNVRLGKWLPQKDILAHPNVKLFITHGGLLSTTETIYFGVPILAIPVLGDQKINARFAVQNGYGLSLPFGELSEEKLQHSLEEILHNPSYKNEAKRRSQIFHDRIVNPMDTGIYWVEHVIRNKGAPHLRVAGIDLPWYKYFLVDVILVIILSVLLLSYIVLKGLKIICRRSSVQKKEKQN